MKALVALAMAIAAPLASAQPFPAKPMRIISTTSPGGVNDTICRAYAGQLSQALGQPVVVENRPGAGSIIGMLTLARSAPDGYTVAITTGEPLVYNPLLYTKLPYDPDNDFASVSQLSRGAGGGIIIGGASLPASTLGEVVSYAKANPGKLNFATWGAGSLPAIYAAWINRQNGIDVQAVPYKGAAPSIAALLSGEAHLTYQSLGFVLPQIKAGKLKPIAIVGSTRSSLLPQVSTLAEQNSDPGMESFFGLFAPGATPVDIVARLSAEYAKATHAPAVQKMWTSLTMQPVGSTPGQLLATVKAERANAAKVFAALGFQPTPAPQ
jgi:tripartite-type tricarboxylate transporter receptor subunit TctC